MALKCTVAEMQSPSAIHSRTLAPSGQGSIVILLFVPFDNQLAALASKEVAPFRLCD